MTAEPMIRTPDHTRAEELEARCRRAMAQLPKADWKHRQDRRDELAFLDALIDAYNDETRTA